MKWLSAEMWNLWNGEPQQDKVADVSPMSTPTFSPLKTHFVTSTTSLQLLQFLLCFYYYYLILLLILLSSLLLLCMGFMIINEYISHLANQSVNLRTTQFCSVGTNKLELTTSIVPWWNPDTLKIPTQTENATVLHLAYGRDLTVRSRLSRLSEQRNINVWTELNWTKHYNKLSLLYQSSIWQWRAIKITISISYTDS